MGTIASVASNYLQSVLSTVLQSSGLPGAAKKNQATNAAASGQPTDNTQLSPYAQITTELQQLQQSNPAQYEQVTAQISTNLQSAAQSATASGNTTLASQLSQLSTDFQTASTTGQLPNFQDLAQAAGGQQAHHHHHHGHGAPDSSSSADTSLSSSSSSGTVSQLLASLQSNSAQSDSLNPMSIILNTLSTAGISSSGGA